MRMPKFLWNIPRYLGTSGDDDGALRHLSPAGWRRVPGRRPEQCSHEDDVHASGRGNGLISTRFGMMVSLRQGT